MAISSSNTGGAWDNAKKCVRVCARCCVGRVGVTICGRYIESGQLKKLIEGSNQPGQESLKKCVGEGGGRVVWLRL